MEGYYQKNRLSLWSYLYKLLEEDESAMLVWVNKATLTFKIEDGHHLAKLWGRSKGKENMTYPKLMRALRYYHGREILEKISGVKKTYQFIRSDKTSHILPKRTSFYRRHSSAVVEDIFKSIDSRLVDTLLLQQNFDATDDSCGGDSSYLVQYENSFIMASNDGLIMSKNDSDCYKRSNIERIDGNIPNLVTNSSHEQLNVLDDSCSEDSSYLVKYENSLIMTSNDSERYEQTNIKKIDRNTPKLESKSSHEQLNFLDESNDNLCTFLQDIPSYENKQNTLDSTLGTLACIIESSFH